MTQVLHLAKIKNLPDGPPREIGDWADTPTARDITRSLDMVVSSDAPSLTMIAGAPGTGKTTALMEFCQRIGQKAILVTAAKGEGTPWNFASLLKEQWPRMEKYSTITDARLIFARYIGPNAILIIDEAQNLSQKIERRAQTGETFEWLRAMADSGGFHLIFSGDLELPRAIEAMPQLQSRMMRPVVINSVSKADIEAVVTGTAFDNPKFIDVLHGVARLKGGLRNVKNVTRVAQLFAGNGTIDLDHIKAAIIDMKLGGVK